MNLRPLLPREHGLWCWTLAPLLAAIVARPTAATTLGALAVFGLFLAGNAARVAAWRATVGMSFVVTALALAASPHEPAWLIGTLAALGTGGVAILGVFGPGVGRALDGRIALELLVIAGFAAAGGALVLADGGPPTSFLAFAALATFEVFGLWWVRGQIARVLPGRRPWRGGGAIAGLLALGTLTCGLLLQAPVTAVVPLADRKSVV